MSNVVSLGCTSGFYVANFNQPLTAPDKWWRFDNQLSHLTARNSRDDSLRIADAAGVRVRAVQAENQRIRLLHARNCTLEGIALTNGAFIVEGQADPSTLPDAPALGLSVRHLAIDHGYLDLHNCRGLTCQDVSITHPVGEGVRTNQLPSSRLEGISVQ